MVDVVCDYTITDKETAELYDTISDPYQITNLVNDPKHKRILKQLRKRLKKEQF